MFIDHVDLLTVGQFRKLPGYYHSLYSKARKINKEDTHKFYLTMMLYSFTPFLIWYMSYYTNVTTGHNAFVHSATNVTFTSPNDFHSLYREKSNYTKACLYTYDYEYNIVVRKVNDITWVYTNMTQERISKAKTCTALDDLMYYYAVYHYYVYATFPGALITTITATVLWPITIIIMNFRFVSQFIMHCIYSVAFWLYS